MDQLDILLSRAWGSLSWQARHDRRLALRRSRRQHMGVLTRPMREWCLVVRASDTRINEFNAVIDRCATLTPDHTLTPNPSPIRDGRGEPIERHEPHTVTLRGKLVRKLTAPVKIPWPGVTYQEAADMLGRTKASLYEWVTHGTFLVNRYPEFKYPEHGRPRGPRLRAPHPDHIAKALGECGHGRPYVWSPSPIDPNNFHGRTPHRVWGTLWQWRWEDFPEEFEQVVQRVPRWRNQPTREGVRPRFLGWEFVCPGRLNHEMEHIGCGKRCTYLYAPQTVWTLGKALADDVTPGFDMPEDSGLSGQWFPGLGDPVAARGPRSFACKACWGVRSAVMSSTVGWNDFITQVSGGLLYGKEVKRPLDICPLCGRNASTSGTRPVSRRRRHPRPRRLSRHLDRGVLRI